MQAAVLPPLSYSVVVSVLSGGQVKDLDPFLVNFLQFSWVGQVGQVEVKLRQADGSRFMGWL